MSPYRGPFWPISVSDISWDYQGSSSASASNGTFPNTINHLSFPNESFTNPAVAAANTCDYDVPLSQTGFTHVQFSGPQPSMPLSIGSYHNQINDASYSDASFHNPAVEAQILYNINMAPPQPGLAIQPMPSNYPPVEQRGYVQPPRHIERYQQRQPSTQPLQLSPASWYPAGSSQGQKRKYMADVDDETMNKDFDLHHQKKVEDKKLILGPNITGKKIPHSEYVGQQDTSRTTKGPSPSKSSKGKSPARGTTGKPKRGPNKSKAAKVPEAEKTAVGDGSGTSQEGERSAKRARTNKNGPPKSSKPQTTGSTDGGRLVEATSNVGLDKKRGSKFVHVPNSQADAGSKMTIFRYEPNFGVDGGDPPDNAPSMPGGSWT